MQSENSDKRDIWFPAKRYGWGWGFPCAWQGWVVMVLWVMAVVIGAIGFKRRPELFIPYEIIQLVWLMIICFIKGEKPKWRWGGD